MRQKIILHTARWHGFCSENYKVTLKVSSFVKIVKKMGLVKKYLLMFFLRKYF